MKAALIHHQGDMGLALDCVIHYQNGHWDKVDETPLLDSGTLSKELISEAYMASVSWAESNITLR